MIRFSNCKINIGLYITGKRPDGYHDLETVFFPVPLYDVLELIDAPQTGITVVGQDIPGLPQNNIIIKAWNLLKADFPALPPVHFYLLKNIPAGAGLGAGSANGAYALMALDDKFELGLTQQQIMGYALQLGSDCPFFILNKPSLAKGRGEVFSDLGTNLANYKIVIVNPGIHISTPWAFGQIKPRPAAANLPTAIVQPVTEWKKLIHNDFEAVVFEAHPEIKEIKESLYDAGAIFSLMSGSGSTVFGLFEKNKNIIYAGRNNYFLKIIDL